MLFLCSRPTNKVVEDLSFKGALAGFKDASDRGGHCGSSKSVASLLGKQRTTESIVQGTLKITI